MFSPDIIHTNTEKDIYGFFVNCYNFKKLPVTVQLFGKEDVHNTVMKNILRITMF